MSKNNRTIKALAALTVKPPSQVASYDFRNLQEVKKYLVEFDNELTQTWNAWLDTQKVLAAHTKIATASALRKIKLSDTRDGGIKAPRGVAKTEVNFTPPDVKKLTKAFSIIEDLHDKSKSLNNVIPMLEVNFKRDKDAGAVLRATKDLLKKVEAKKKDAYKTIEALAKNHEPKDFSAMIQPVIEAVSKMYAGLYTKLSQSSYVSPHTSAAGDDEVYFSRYVELTDFTADDDFEHKNYFVVFTCVVNLAKKTRAIYVTTLRKFAPPGRYSLGVSGVNSEDLLQKTYMMLSADNFSLLDDRQVIPEPIAKKMSFQLDPKAVKKYEVKDDIISLQFHKVATPKQITDAMNEVKRGLYVALRSVFPKMIIKDRKYTRYNHPYAELVVTIPGRDDVREVRLNARQARTLQDNLGIDDAKLMRLLKAIAED